MWQKKCLQIEIVQLKRNDNNDPQYDSWGTYLNIKCAAYCCRHKTAHKTNLNNGSHKKIATEMRENCNG